jgi:hypothetical protein
MKISLPYLASLDLKFISSNRKRRNVPFSDPPNDDKGEIRQPRQIPPPFPLSSLQEDSQSIKGKISKRQKGVSSKDVRLKQEESAKERLVNQRHSTESVSD